MSMNVKLRDAGFRAGDALSKVAEQTGLDVAQVRAQAGLAPGATVLDDASLDRKLPFPDGFVAAGATSTSVKDLAQVQRGGGGDGATRATVGGLLRAKLEQQLPVKQASAPLPKREAFPSDAAFLRATKESLVEQHGMRSVDDVLALARAIEPGVHAWIHGDDANALLANLMHALRTSSTSIEEVPQRLEAALARPRPAGSGAGGAVTVDVDALPLDPTKHEFQARHMGALSQALVKLGVDTDAHVRELARRLGEPERLVAAQPETALWHLLHDMANGMGLDAMIGALKQALATPLGPAPRRSLTLGPASLPDGTGAPFMGRLVGDMVRALTEQGVDTIGLARAFAARLGVANEADGDRASSIVYQALSALHPRVGDDMKAFASAVRDAFAAGPLVEHVDAGLPPHVDTSALATAHAKGDRWATQDALLAIVDTPAKANELADRLERRPYLVAPDQSSLRNWTFELLNMVDVPSVIGALA